MKVCFAVALILFCGTTMASTLIGRGRSLPLCADQTYPSCYNPNCILDEQFLNSDSTCYCRCGGLNAGQRRVVVGGTFVEGNTRQFGSGLGSLQVNSFGSSGNIVDAGTGSGRRLIAGQGGGVIGGTFVDSRSSSNSRQFDSGFGNLQVNGLGSSGQFVGAGSGSGSRLLGVVGSGDRLVDVSGPNVGRQSPFASQLSLGNSGVRRVNVGGVSGLGNVAVIGNGGRRVEVTRPFYAVKIAGGSSNFPADVGRQIRTTSSVGQTVGMNRFNQRVGFVQDGSASNLWNDVGGNRVRFGGSGSPIDVIGSIDGRVEVFGSGIPQVGSGSLQVADIGSEGGQSDRGVKVHIFETSARNGAGGLTGGLFGSYVSDGVDTDAVDTGASGGFDARRSRPGGGY